jgi:hypothetical protein
MARKKAGEECLSKGSEEGKSETPRPDLLGNQFWKARSKHGREPIFSVKDQLWEACQEYFQWCEDNPLQEEKLFAYQGVISRGVAHKMRAMTIAGLCLFLDICEKTWANYRNNDDFLQVVTRAEKIIYEQKFTGAAADLLNPNIIARDLGLAERQVIKTQDSRIEVEFVRAQDENPPAR